MINSFAVKRCPLILRLAQGCKGGVSSGEGVLQSLDVGSGVGNSNGLATAYGVAGLGVLAFNRAVDGDIVQRITAPSR